jgi:predicted nucleic acid-binding Zn ribbon protein
MSRPCEICGGPIPPHLKQSAKTCSSGCLQVKNRLRQRNRRAAARGGARLCRVCGAPIEVGRTAKTCSDACQTVWMRDYQRQWKRRDAIVRPDRQTDRARRLQERRRNDPDYADSLRAKERAWRAARAAHETPDAAAERHRRAAAHWEAHRAEIIARRSARIEAMTPDERAAWEDRMRRYGREFRRRWREKLAADPDAHRQQLAREAQWRANRALQGIAATGAALEQMMEDGDATGRDGR